jgi:SulP family sulfate permease
MSDFIPFLSWIRTYNQRHVKADLLAGLTVAVVAVPQCMAYALIAGLPVQYGLYAAIVPAIIGSLWGSSAQLITGPTTAISLVVSSLVRLAPPGSSHYVELAFFLALMVGVIQIAMGVARLGSLLNFVSHSVILGFTLIGFKQIPNLLGLKLERTSLFIESLVQIANHLHETHLITLALGLGTVAVIISLRKLRPSWPGKLIALVVIGGVVALFKLDAQGVAVVGAIPRSLPPFHFPKRSSNWILKA